MRATVLVFLAEGAPETILTDLPGRGCADDWSVAFVSDLSELSWLG